MAKKKPIGQQVDTILRDGDALQQTFDLHRFDVFVTGLGVQFEHYKAIPSPINKSDRGDLRRNYSVDTISSNGFIYVPSGTFSATMTDNSRKSIRGDSGTLDPSDSRLVMPRFYDTEEGVSKGKRIYVAPGDRLYVANKNADVLVANYQEMTYESGIDNVPMFPIEELEMCIDSNGNRYKEGYDFKITKNGAIRWLSSGKNPGMNMDTGLGNIYSIRYLYRAFWYITQINKEVRITNITEGDERTPTRAPYFVTITREYIYHNQNKGDEQNELKPKEEEKNRVQAAPKEPINPSKSVIPVEMSGFETYKKKKE